MCPYIIIQHLDLVQQRLGAQRLGVVLLEVVALVVQGLQVILFVLLPPDFVEASLCLSPLLVLHLQPGQRQTQVKKKKITPQNKRTHRRTVTKRAGNLFSTMGTATAGFLFSPSTMSAALSPYILCTALRWTTSEEPPSVLSSLKRSCSSADMRDSRRCTVSRARIVARLVSSTTSSCQKIEGRCSVN